MVGTHIRTYWDVEGGRHRRLDFTAREDASRVRHRDALLVLGIARRAGMGPFPAGQRLRLSPRQSSLPDFDDTMKKSRCRLAWQKLRFRHK